jgi:uncharacterized protein (TIGR02145 family)
MKIVFILFLLPISFLLEGQSALIVEDSIQVPDYRQEFLFTDNCNNTLISVLQDPPIGTWKKKTDPNFIVTLTAEDLSGNKSMIDFEVTMFDTVRIGNQTWMADNLRTTRYTDGSPIFEGQYGTNLQTLDTYIHDTTGSYYWYGNDSLSLEYLYGKLYNYYVINTDKICPSGWRVPTEDDWEELISFIDPNVNFVRHEASTIAGGMLKDTVWWADTNLATNDFGFNARPGGCKAYAGNFSMGGTFGYYAFIPRERKNGSIAFRWVTESLFMRDQISSYVSVSVRCIKK